MKKVFLASRFEEFKEIREKIKEELLSCNMSVIALDDNKAITLSPIERSLQNVRDSDVFILLIGDTYGGTPTGYSKSYTHLEYEEALKNKKNIYAFAIGDSYKNYLINYSSIANMAEWQKTLEENHTLSMFEDEDDIGLIVHKIITSIYDVENKTWFDEDTGLMWQVKIDSTEEHGRFPWNDIFRYCDNKNKENYDGFNDWRVPTIEELETLVTNDSNPNSYGYDEETFIKKPLLYSMSMRYGRFWSSTSNHKNSDFAFGINFNRKRVNSQSKNGNKEKYKTRYIRCVRLYLNEKIDIEWNKVKNLSKKEIELFLKKFANSKYENKAKLKLKELLKKEKVLIEELNPIEQRLMKVKNNNIPKSTLLLNSIKNKLFDDIKDEALIELKKIMQKEKVWKELSTAKNPNKDKKYQRTLEVIQLLQSVK